MHFRELFGNKLVARAHRYAMMDTISTQTHLMINDHATQCESRINHFAFQSLLTDFNEKFTFM